jgi:hypothetical protein
MKLLAGGETVWIPSSRKAALRNYRHRNDRCIEISAAAISAAALSVHRNTGAPLLAAKSRVTAGAVVASVTLSPVSSSPVR